MLELVLIRKKKIWRGNDYKKGNDVKIERLMVLIKKKKKIPYFKVIWCSLSKQCSLGKKNGTRLEFPQSKAQAFSIWI